ncbi:unnamed protein product [Absidia cylindrospora]
MSATNNGNESYLLSESIERRSPTDQLKNVNELGPMDTDISNAHEQLVTNVVDIITPPPFATSDYDEDLGNEINLDEEDDDITKLTVVTQTILPPTTSTTIRCPVSMIPTCSKTTTATSTELATAYKTANQGQQNQQQQQRQPLRRRSSSQLDDLLNEMGIHQHNDNGLHETKDDNDDNDDDDDDDDDHLESDLDEELKQITEANRHIDLPAEPNENDPIKLHDNNHRNHHHHNHHGNSNHGHRNHKPTTPTDSMHDHDLRELLVFSDTATHRLKRKCNHKAVSMVYGAGMQGNQIRKGGYDTTTRHYLIACDFSHESLHAMEWTMGTMLRDHDTLHIVTVANREDLAEESALMLENEMDHILNGVIDEAKKRLSRMMLYDIKLVFYSMAGQVKDVLEQLIQTLPLTMVVCGSRGRGTMKGMLMGSVSTFLVHQSPVPVAVIRPQKKRKKETRHTITATPLSESVKSGHLHVDELG